MTSPLDTLPYAQAPKPKANHNRNYMIALLVLAFFEALGAMSTFFIVLMPKDTSANPTAKWAILFVVAMHGLYFAIIVLTLLIRAVSHGDFRVIWTKAANIVLLILIPFGTAVGIYGLLKVDKQSTAANT